MAGDPSAVAWEVGNIDVFYRGTNEGLRNSFWSTPDWSSGGLGEGGVMGGEPDAVAW